jgi:hypothetical protein
MTERHGLSDRYLRASPWPLFVALGLALSEVGIFVGLFPVAVFGLLLFVGSVAGILTEAEYVVSPWPTVAALGLLLTAVAAALLLLQVPLEAITLANYGTNGVLDRTLAVIAAGVTLAVLGIVVRTLETQSA